MRKSILFLLILLFSCQKDFYLEDLRKAESQISSLNLKIQDLEKSQEELLERISNLLNEKASLLENNQELSNQISKLQEDLTNSSISLEEALNLLEDYEVKIALLEKWGNLEDGEYVPVHEFLATPSPDSELIIPVIIINYIPSIDGATITNKFAELDAVRDYGNQVKYGLPVDTVKNYWLGSDIRQKWGMEEGSRYHGQENSTKKPYLGFNIIADINLYKMDFTESGEIDYFKLFERIDLRNKVENLGVKEIWFNHFPDGYSIPESNMSSPHKIFTHNGRLTSDVSNSYRYDDDLPIYNQTYVVYGQTGWYANNIHNHGHQIEAQLSIWEMYRNNYDLSYLFFQKFGGYPEGEPAPYYRGGRVGLVHYPPNADGDYHYDSDVYVESDILDWIPNGGGNKTLINKNAWHYERTMPVQTPSITDHQKWGSYGGSNRIGGDPHGGWLIYWMQSIPSKNNNIPYDHNGVDYTITNWWDIIYKWDETIMNNRNLFE
jgi:hypothetical protein